MGKIGADTGLMRDAARRMRGAAEQFERCGPLMGRSIDSLGAVWSGNARNACLERWGAVAPAFPSGAQALYTYADSLERMADHLEREANKSWLEKAVSSIGSVLGVLGGIFSFVLPPLGLGLSLVGGGMTLGAAIPDLIRYGDVRSFLKNLSSSVPLPPGIASQVIRTGLEIGAEARNLGDAVDRLTGMIPGDSIAGTAVKVIKSDNVTDGILNATGFLGDNDALDTAVTLTKIARADNFDEVLSAVSERLPAGSAEALRVLQAAGKADNFGEVVATTLANLPPGVANQAAAVLGGLVPPELTGIAQTIIGADPVGKLHVAEAMLGAARSGDLGAVVSAGATLASGVPLPEPVRSAAGFLYDTQQSIIPNAGRAWGDLSRIELGPLGRDLPVAVGINGGTIRISLPGTVPVANSGGIFDWAANALGNL